MRRALLAATLLALGCAQAPPASEGLANPVAWPTLSPEEAARQSAAAAWHDEALYLAFYQPSVPFRAIPAVPLTPALGRFQVFRSLAEWPAGASAPPVDFAREEVLAFWGEGGGETSAGEFTAVVDQPQGLLAQYVRWDPGYLNDHEQEFGLTGAAIALPRSAKPVVFAPELIGRRADRARVLGYEGHLAEAPALPLPGPLVSPPTYVPR